MYAKINLISSFSMLQPEKWAVQTGIHVLTLACLYLWKNRILNVKNADNMAFR